MFMHKSNNLDL